MIYEYVLTAFKVVVGVITNDRLAIAAMIALGLMLIWVIFSLCFSFQARFTSGVRKINNFVSRNGLDAKGGLNDLVAKMPSEFIRGYNAFQMNPKSLPSEHIKRFDSLDVELSGGVFNQNKSIIKTYINFVFVALILFSFAIISTETVLTGYLIAEAFIIPMSFLFVAKVFYYVYTAIRQHQYRMAVDEFHEMLDNMDKASTGYAAASLGLISKDFTSGEAQTVVIQASQAEKEESPVEPTVIREITKEILQPIYITYEEAREQGIPVPEITEVKEKQPIEETVEELSKTEETAVEEHREDVVSEELATEESNMEREMVEETEAEHIKAETEDDVVAPKTETFSVEIPEDVTEGNPEKSVEDPKDEDAIELKDQALDHSETIEPIVDEGEYQDNFKPDFSDLLEEEEPVVEKRKRGRPRKEVSETGELVIKNDKEFEEALVRAEKLMRKNEEPLSASQTKRVEKQIKELVDAMSKYKEGK